MLRIAKCRAGRLSFRLRWDWDHPAHEDYRAACNTYSNTLERIKTQHWEGFLSDRNAISLWNAHRLVSNSSTDGGKTRIPDLEVVQPDGSSRIVSGNAEKAAALFDNFYPPSPCPVDRSSTSYRPPAFRFTPITDQKIQQIISKLRPYKAPSGNEYSNTVFIRCADILVPLLEPLYRASVRLNHCPNRWRNSTTVVIRKPGKPDYQVLKVYQPIELLCCMGKILSAVIPRDIMRESERTGILPAHQFGCRPGRTSTDARHYFTDWVKNAWRKGLVVSVLFLDVKGAFPSVDIHQLVHNMRKRGVPKEYTDWILTKGAPRKTTVSFDDFKSDPLTVEGGLPQGCSLSPISYVFYNAPLDDVPNKKHGEDSATFADDTKLMARAKNFRAANRKITSMMVWRKGVRVWARTHNCSHELDKTGLVGYTGRKERDPDNPLRMSLLECPPIVIEGVTINSKPEHKSLGIIFDRELRFKSQVTAALDKGAKWHQAFARVARVTKGAKGSIMRRFYLTVAVPKVLHGASVWLTPRSRHNLLSRGPTAKLARTHRQGALLITGVMRSTATDVVVAHANLLPFHLLVSKLCHREALRIATLPASHPLHKPVRRAAKRYVRSHRSALHELTRAFRLEPKQLETIPTVRHPADW